jgi:alkaline phosphatase
MFQEVMDFNSAIEVAYEFYRKHKDETLIVVTADHETGGMVLGYSGAYELNLKAMERQKVSVVRMTEILLAEKETTWGRVNALLEENMGTTADIKEEMDAKVTMDYNLAKKLSFEAMHKLNREALLSWASYNHSGTFVPLFAIGCGAGEFHGVIDNTDIPRIMRELKGFKE